MPELPEVENVKLGLQKLGVVGQTFERVELLRANLRTPLSEKLCADLPGQSIKTIERRAKFILFNTKEFTLVSHLGMTGSWRVAQKPQKHDHVILHFQSGLALVYNDPRRFGLMECYQRQDVGNSRWLKDLGPEPLDENLKAEQLFAQARGIQAPIKNFIMDQKRIVGVGNIYASEALYRARIRPTRATQKVSRSEMRNLLSHIRKILKDAIAAGGSTIRDYRNSEGQDGSFQQRFRVYGRQGEPCKRCRRAIRSQFVAGRNTYWCPQCQS